MATYSPITVARFWSKVRVTKGLDLCWEWSGSRTPSGYGKIKIDGVCFTASRVAWELHNGEPLGERLALHSCDNPCCCNPSHIFPGNHEDNMSDMASKGRAKGWSGVGEKNARAKLTASQVMEIKVRLAMGHNNTEIAGDYGVTHSLISAIRRGKAWTSVGREGIEPPTFPM